MKQSGFGPGLLARLLLVSDPVPMPRSEAAPNPRPLLPSEGGPPDSCIQVVLQSYLHVSRRPSVRYSAFLSRQDTRPGCYDGRILIWLRRAKQGTEASSLGPQGPRLPALVINTWTGLVGCSAVNRETGRQTRTTVREGHRGAQGWADNGRRGTRDTAADTREGTHLRSNWEDEGRGLFQGKLAGVL